MASGKGDRKASLQVTCRLARHSDYDDVVHYIGDVYNGVDYLLHYYHQYIDDPNYYCYVAEVNGRVVSPV